MLRKISLILIVLFSSTSLAEASHTPNPTVTTRDSRGIKTGTMTQNNDGSTTLRDSRGIKTGTMTPNNDGSTTLRDSRGIKTGKIDAPRGKKR